MGTEKAMKHEGWGFAHDNCYMRDFARIMRINHPDHGNVAACEDCL